MDDAEVARIRKALASRMPGPFHLSDLYGADWQRIWIGDKVKLGNAFQRAVSDGQFEFEGVEDTGRKAKQGRIYIKRRT
ncbi:DUF1413 domain-containing protein [Consotaella aegiceratis]|uniref:DUF1413 domain-containing protein n=1 Tax=Consotaella aegiceratis TaxID=3097961 RepID=UPI002F428C94